MITSKTYFQNVGWIGTGVMGNSMCSHLLAKEWAVSVYNRTKSKTDGLVAIGAVCKDSVKEVAENSEIIFTMVSYPADVEEVYFGNGGLLKNAEKGTVFVDMSTTRPDLAVKINELAAQKGCYFLDAPVTGGDIGARNATLSILVGGDAESFERVQPFFELMGKTVTLFGPAGSGQRAKLANQIVIAGSMIGVCEGLIFAHRAGLDLETLVGAIRSGGAGCWTLDNLAPRIIRSDFAPGFFIDHFVKDLGLALEEASKLNIDLPGLSLASKLYITAQELGYGKSGTHALYKAIEKVSELTE